MRRQIADVEAYLKSILLDRAGMLQDSSAYDDDGAVDAMIRRLCLEIARNADRGEAAMMAAAEQVVDLFEADTGTARQ